MRFFDFLCEWGWVWGVGVGVWGGVGRIRVWSEAGAKVIVSNLDRFE